ncbi:hypothetical protein [Microvirga yunnanensis]|uniref:hypothetical protein n=1 Tax=Microvirga yunnanensis TaxID=2953740 RepID=UPI0021C64C54|nr:hypothetical protein [Microvirga sp. HBU65207]
MDWFEKLTGFQERGYAETQAQFEVSGRQLISRSNGQQYAIGELELPSLTELRLRGADVRIPGRLRVRNRVGDVRRLHADAEFEGALFQVASQFNLLEMTGPGVTPEDGITRYQSDRTQGPACAMAAGAATIYRNYLAPVGVGIGQTATRQIDALADLGDALAARLALSRDALWIMRNGYALASQESLKAISTVLSEEGSSEALKGLLRIGVHWDIEVTDVGPLGPLVSQAFCSALPVAYSGVPSADWARFGSLVLEAAYEATLWAGLLNAARGASNKVLLTRLGGGAFGNPDSWIDAALTRALELFADHGLEVILVSYHSPAEQALRLEKRFGG